jgi:hypothetical protein
MNELKNQEFNILKAFKEKRDRKKVTIYNTNYSV